ncbi:hypothetical protein HAX54_052788, partial [Datura stramonium]|nr:hypothetical protein [Datura stramonium]
DASSLPFNVNDSKETLIFGVLANVAWETTSDTVTLYPLRKRKSDRHPRLSGKLEQSPPRRSRIEGLEGSRGDDSRRR